ncbi:hypothetical protein FBD94_21560 [Pedobacter hiemivivus]|uniref:PKD-like family protein n=1 Tax=Pedobacter hiemivivus TaxID=2530454 RepID=A0A4V5PBV7_9SPHI|nr:PKD-like family lipoprotein [Pedobacter hiemivivus]TKC57216.1 hypothetical protein FBD94_21560 [Pedobacter hiemivivus]
MKKIYILIIGLFCILTYSCVKDKNQFKPDLATPVVNGFEKTYSVYTFQDVLKINPTVANESDYDYFWTLFTSNYTPSAGVVPRGDTLSRTKDLTYEVKVNPGDYFLVFNVKNKKTGITQMISSNVSVSTLTMNGWYLLKDDGVNTDFDFIHANGRIDNWMAHFNGGQSLLGKSVKSIFSSGFKTGINSNELFNVLVVLSDKDAGIYRIDNGKKLMGFENMFFTTPAVRKPQNILQPMGNNYLNLINDGKVYTMVKGAYFADPPIANFKVAPVAAIGAMGIAFDDNSKSIIGINDANYYPLGAHADLIKNLDAEIVWMAGYPAVRNVAIALFRKKNGEGYLARLNTSYGQFTGPPSPNNAALVRDTKTVPQAHGLMSADIIGGNYDSDYIYYAKENKVYLTDAVSLQETLEFALPVGETVTCIQHIKYPQPAGNVEKYTTDYLVIASYVAGKYKVWLHKISTTGTIQTLDKPNFEGQGKVTSINYMEKGSGSRTF